MLSQMKITFHLTEQKYFYYKNKWWFHSNKQGFSTMPSRNRSDFKQALSTLQRLQQEARGRTTRAYFILRSRNNGSWHRVHLLHGGIVKVPGDLLTIQKVKEEASQVLNERGDPFPIVFWRKPSKMAFTNSFYFGTDGSFTADGGPL